MIHDIEEYIEPGQDDVRAYPLMTTVPPVTFGRDRLANGVMLLHSKGSGLNADPLHVGRQHLHVCQTGSDHPGRHCHTKENADEAIQTADLMKKGLRPWSGYLFVEFVEIQTADLMKKGLRLASSNASSNMLIQTADLMKKGLRPDSNLEVIM